MAVTNYYSINGQIIGESTSGVRTDYLTDALGSVTGTVNQSGVVINTYRYKPYGDLLSKTGTGADPAFGWVGTQGYKQTQKKFSNFYVRARHYGSAQSRWASIDPIGFYGGDWNLYRYVQNRPIMAIDPSGLSKISSAIRNRIPNSCSSVGSKPLPNVPETDPAYKCYVKVCQIYNKDRSDTDKLENDYCPGINAGVFGPIICGWTNACLPDIAPSDPKYIMECDVPFGSTPVSRDPPLTRGIISLCCIECGVRLCMSVIKPHEKNLMKWLKSNMERCQKGLPITPIPAVTWPSCHINSPSYPYPAVSF